MAQKSAMHAADINFSELNSLLVDLVLSLRVLSKPLSWLLTHVDCWEGEGEGEGEGRGGGGGGGEGGNHVSSSLVQVLLTPFLPIRPTHRMIITGGGRSIWRCVCIQRILFFTIPPIF